MTTSPTKNVRQMPKGGRKGGSVFPRVSLVDAISYAHKLVSKTHTAPQPQDVILSGVVGSKGGIGAVRMSALKQYGFLKGDVKTNFSADTLAKKISAAPPDELIALYREAVLKPTIFKKLFDTFHGDTVSKAKLKQRAADLKVHPDETISCVDLYVGGMTTAGLVTVEGDQVKHLASSHVTAQSVIADSDDDGVESSDSDPESEELNEAANGIDANEGTPPNASDGARAIKPKTAKENFEKGPRAVFNVSVTLDSSLDIDKLQKQLELLKRFGAI
ncbi:MULTISPECIES: hypothetical protein [Variovorax]|jgi:hypothetical protein|nr:MULTISPECIES: hypothetical protein [Variovorax]UKI06229.1 hypothetical protein L3V85_25875 [Variovorax paradoxus]